MLSQIQVLPLAKLHGDLLRRWKPLGQDGCVKTNPQISTCGLRGLFKNCQFLINEYLPVFHGSARRKWQLLLPTVIELFL